MNMDFDDENIELGDSASWRNISGTDRTFTNEDDNSAIGHFNSSIYLNQNSEKCHSLFKDSMTAHEDFVDDKELCNLFHSVSSKAKNKGGCNRSRHFSRHHCISNNIKRTSIDRNSGNVFELKRPSNPMAHSLLFPKFNNFVSGGFKHYKYADVPKYPNNDSLPVSYAKFNRTNDLFHVHYAQGDPSSLKRRASSMDLSVKSVSFFSGVDSSLLAQTSSNQSSQSCLCAMDCDQSDLG